jgi:hypothetical protein
MYVPADDGGGIALDDQDAHQVPVLRKEGVAGGVVVVWHDVAHKSERVIDLLLVGVRS